MTYTTNSFFCAISSSPTQTLNSPHGRLFVGMLELNLEAGTAKVPSGAVVMTRNIHTVQDFELAKAYLSHYEAAAQAASDTLHDALGEYVLATVE
jgi:hypothetical protein